MDNTDNNNNKILKDNCSDDTVVLSSLYLAPIEYYSKAFNAKRIIIEANDNFQKQTFRNRCNILGANGVMQLNIPIEKSLSKKCMMKDIKISDHGNWQHLHWNAIISAYNSSPFFEYYEDDFCRFYENKFTFLHDFNEELRTLIFDMLSIDVRIEYSDLYITELQNGWIDNRETIHPKRNSGFINRPYWQVFKEKFNFTPNLSIIDLLFNMGNESRLYLK